MQKVPALYDESILKRAEYLSSHLNGQIFSTAFHALTVSFPLETKETLPEGLRQEVITITDLKELVSALDYVSHVELGYTRQSYFDTLHLYKQAKLQRDTLKNQIEQIRKEIRIIHTSIKNTKFQNEWLVKENHESDHKRTFAGVQFETLSSSIQELELELSKSKNREAELRSEILPLTLIYNEKHLEVLNLSSQWEELKKSINITDTMLHPRRSLECKRRLKELIVQKEQAEKIANETSEKRAVLQNELDALLSHNQEISGKIQMFKQDQAQAKQKLTSHISHIDSGEKMISNGIDRLHKLEDRKKDAEERLNTYQNDFEKIEKNLISYAKDLIHVYVGYDKEYQGKLEELSKIIQRGENITSDQLQILLFAPYLFVIDEKADWYQEIKNKETL